MKEAQPPRAGAFSLELLDNRYPQLHGIRVLAIITVVQYHVTSLIAGEPGIDLSPSWSRLSVRIFFGMDLFFVLSGFLIGSIILRSLDARGSQGLRRFYVRRASRTFPSYYAVLTFLALTSTLTLAQQHHLPWEFVYGTDFFPVRRAETLMYWGWSLALEEQFYLLVPLLFFVLYRLRSDRARLALLIALWASALFVRVGIYAARPSWDLDALWLAVYTKLYTRFDTLVAGILLAFVHARNGTRIERWLETSTNRSVLGVVALVCFGVLILQDGDAPLVLVLSWGTLTSVMYFALLLLLLHSDGPVRRALSLPVFRRIATLGYGVYLVHIPIYVGLLVPIIRRLASTGAPMWALWPSSLAALLVVSLAAAYALHITIEKPSLRLRERIAP